MLGPGNELRRLLTPQKETARCHVPPGEGHSTTYSPHKTMNPQSDPVSLSICRKYKRNMWNLHHRHIPDSGKLCVPNGSDPSTDNLQVKDRDGGVNCRLKES